MAGVGPLWWWSACVRPRSDPQRGGGNGKESFGMTMLRSTAALDSDKAMPSSVTTGGVCSKKLYKSPNSYKIGIFKGNYTSD